MNSFRYVLREAVLTACHTVEATHGPTREVAAFAAGVGMEAAAVATVIVATEDVKFRVHLLYVETLVGLVVFFIVYRIKILIRGNQSFYIYFLRF